MITGTDNTGMDTLYTWGTPEKQTWRHTHTHRYLYQKGTDTTEDSL